VKAIRQNFRQSGQIPSLSCTDGEVRGTGSNSILTSRGWFGGCQEGEAGVHNHKNISVKRQLRMFKLNKVSKIYKRHREKTLFFLAWLGRSERKSFVIDI
jgi:hypothetical protein